MLKTVTYLALASVLIAGPALAEDTALPKQTVNQDLRAKLPESIRTAGKMVSVNSGSFPPTRSSTAPPMSAVQAPI